MIFGGIYWEGVWMLMEQRAQRSIWRQTGQWMWMDVAHRRGRTICREEPAPEAE